MAIERNIIEIDEDLCTGCGKCVPDCAEGAIEIVNGKARLVADNLCDGIGACLGSCPENALKIIQRQADEFDEKEVMKKLESKSVCNSIMTVLDKNPWPLQFLLVPPDSDIFNQNNILISADCVSHSLKDYHQTLAVDKRILIGCPKLDNIDEYRKRFLYIFKNKKLEYIKVARMEVPCCSKIENLLKDCIAQSQRKISLEIVVVGLDGKIKTGLQEKRLL